jgi:dinuclear metal center YbgI/SA1388 family protein
VTGVSANLALFRQAKELEADLIVVHHGLLWGPGLERVTGVAAERLKFLLENRMSLCGYHLPLDRHGEVGNNAGLADALGLGPEREWFGELKGHAVALAGSFPEPLTRTHALARIAERVTGGHEPGFVFPHGPETVRRVGLCSGAASDLIEDAARAGCDLFLTGELAERAGELARELQITLVAAGHYATEVFGPKRLAEAIQVRFKGVSARFVDVPSPL